MTSAELLSINRPEDLFPGDPKEARRVYLILARTHHPDNGGSADVFAHLHTLYQAALKKFAEHRWNGSQLIALNVARSKDVIQVQARAGEEFQFGHSLFSDDAVWYLFDPNHRVRAERVLAVSKQFKYSSRHMQAEFERYLPAHAKLYELANDSWLVRIAKTSDAIRLRDLHTHLGPLDPRQCAWMVSALMNLACYFAYTGIVHHDISPSTCFVSPPYHSVSVLGGWEHAVVRGKTIVDVPQRTYDVMPYRAKMRKIASTRTDLELIRLTIREVFAKAPEPMQTWLHSVSHATAVEQYKEWQTVLERTFGPRKFIAMLTGPDDVYGHEQKKGRVS